VLKDANSNGSFYEVEVATARVDKKCPHLTEDNAAFAIKREEKIELEIKAREKEGTQKDRFGGWGAKFADKSNPIQLRNLASQELWLLMMAQKFYGSRSLEKTI
jgi:hypothetical protein